MNLYKLPPTSYKLVVLVGPTSSGKSELAVKLAKRFNGEIISADSRQIYKGLNIGTGKVRGKWSYNPNLSHNSYFYKGVPHYCIDYISPKKQYSASLFKLDAEKAIREIVSKGKLPILCGGTAQWIDAVVYNQQLPEVRPNLKFRAKLEKLSTKELWQKLMVLDRKRGKNIDRFNKRRLIRALEIVTTTGKPVPPLSLTPLSNRQTASAVRPFTAIWLGIKTEQASLYKKIDLRLKQRLKQGMVKEVRNLHAKGLSWKKLESFGLEYRFVSMYLQNKISYEDMLVKLSFAIKHYSKRQLTWWKRNKNIKFINSLSPIKIKL